MHVDNFQVKQTASMVFVSKKLIHLLVNVKPLVYFLINAYVDRQAKLN